MAKATLALRLESRDVRNAQLSQHLCRRSYEVELGPQDMGLISRIETALRYRFGRVYVRKSEHWVHQQIMMIKVKVPDELFDDSQELFVATVSEQLQAIASGC